MHPCDVFGVEHLLRLFGERSHLLSAVKRTYCYRHRHCTSSFCFVFVPLGQLLR